MAQKVKSYPAFGIALLVLFVFTLAGGIVAAYSTNGNAFYPGLIVGFLIGVGLLATADYAAAQIRRD